VTKGTLFGVIGAVVVVVAALAVLTPTVIVGDGDTRTELAAADAEGETAPPEIAPPGIRPAPGGRQGVPGLRERRPFGGLRGCLEKQGLGRLDRGATPDLRTMRKALKACRGAVPGIPFGR
jgi:hypothetical protein